MRRLKARSLHINALILCAAVAGTLAAAAPVPAHAEGWDRGDWRRHEWREHEWRDRRAWREHEWREYHRPYSYYGTPGYYVAPGYAPGYIYAPPPVVYPPPPSLGLDFSFR
jgi:hypothetical protein